MCLNELLNAIQYNTIQYSGMQCNAIQYNAIQYNTVQCNVMQYDTIVSLSLRKLHSVFLQYS